MNLRAKILSTYIGLAATGLLLLGLLAVWLIEGYLARRLELNVRTKLDVVASLIGNGSLSVDSTQDENLLELARLLNVRLSVIAKDGVVVFDSEVSRDSLVNLENHRSRPEIIKASEGIVGLDKRASGSTHHEYLYAARMVSTHVNASLDSGYIRVAAPMEEFETLSMQVKSTVIVIGCLSLLLVTVVSLGVSKRITKPILHILRSTQAITNGDLSQRISISSKDEIGMLANSINEMAEKLSNDIATLQKLERVRSEFLGNVSHELRTPIFSLQGFLETLLDGAMDDPRVNRDFLEKAHRHAERLNSLLNDLIEISRIESGEMKMSFRYFSVTEFLQGLVDELRPAAARKGLMITLQSEFDTAAKVYGDKERLRQAITNLIDNAMKYTDSGGRITVAARPAKHQCEISVADTGTGIAEEHQSRIFERFYRVDRDRSREVGGTGLGLAIVKHIVEAHGSKISVSSKLGEGSIFSFTLKR
jgi:two-component system phosphate regulon sensor histidine kinase PhoR